MLRKWFTLKKLLKCENTEPKNILEFVEYLLCFGGYQIENVSDKLDEGTDEFDNF